MRSLCIYVTERSLFVLFFVLFFMICLLFSVLGVDTGRYGTGATWIFAVLSPDSMIDGCRACRELDERNANKYSSTCNRVPMREPIT